MKIWYLKVFLKLFCVENRFKILDNIFVSELFLGLK